MNIFAKNFSYGKKGIWGKELLTVLVIKISISLILGKKDIGYEKPTGLNFENGLPYRKEKVLV